MNKRLNRPMYIYAFVFLLIFNFSDVIIYSSSEIGLNVLTLVAFLLPVIMEYTILIMMKRSYQSIFVILV